MFLFFKKRRYDVIFYYPQHFNRSKEGKNDLFEPYYNACINNNLSYIIFEEPYPDAKRNQAAIPFDFVFFIIILVRKLFCDKNIIQKDRRIGVLLSYTIFRNIKFNNFIVLSKSMISVFSAINPLAKIFDVQHGIIYPKKLDYFYKGSVSKQLIANNVYLLIFGNRFKEILIEQDATDFMKSNSYVVGFDNVSSANHVSFNKHVLITLQFTHDHKQEENTRLLEELYDFITSAKRDIIFHLKNHPRFNNDIDLSNIIKLDNVYFAPEDLNDCFKICSLHATAYSTSVFEASLLGIPSILINSSRVNIFQKDFAYPLEYNINDFSNNDLYKESSVTVKAWASKYYSPFNSIKFISLLK